MKGFPKMVDVVLESVCAIAGGGAVLYFLYSCFQDKLIHHPGCGLLVTGISLTCLGMVLNVVENFDSINALLFLGNSHIQVFFETVVGYTLGLVFIVFGLLRWFQFASSTNKHYSHIEREDESARIAELESVFANVNSLEGLIAVCAFCKKVRDDDGYWQLLEHYLQARTGSQVSHGVCPDCAREQYPEIQKRVDHQ